MSHHPCSHHCKKKEPYNCIMQEFYFDEHLPVCCQILFF